MSTMDGEDSSVLLDDARKEIKSLRDELFAIRRSAWDAQRHASGNAAELLEAKSTIDNLRGRAAEGDASCKQLKAITAELAHVKDSQEGVLHELRKHRAARSVLDKELGSTRAQNADLSRSVAALQLEIARTTELLESKSAQVLLLKKQLVDAEDEVRNFLYVLQLRVHRKRLPSTVDCVGSITVRR